MLLGNHISSTIVVLACVVIALPVVRVEVLIPCLGIAAMSAARFKAFLKPYHGVEGGVLLRAKMFRNLGQKYPMFAKVNNALFMAPAWKWGLSIVPLIGLVKGYPKPEDLDLNQSVALAFTGVVWSYYGFLVKPTAYLLVAVNMAMLLVHGNNVRRKLEYNESKKPKAIEGPKSA